MGLATELQKRNKKMLTQKGEIMKKKTKKWPK